MRPPAPLQSMPPIPLHILELTILQPEHSASSSHIESETSDSATSSSLHTDSRTSASTIAPSTSSPTSPLPTME
ncbi:hypothetical protein M0R45_025524 [Rubus argutus]|uniref:Uncharacterized protein n=1 Tax=Rubus argutus TaxID=59490 RepID=A0AAW1WUW3_RUBAR